MTVVLLTINSQRIGLEGQSPLDSRWQQTGVGLRLPPLPVQCRQGDVELLPDVLTRQLTLKSGHHHHIDPIQCSLSYLGVVLPQEVEPTFHQNRSCTLLGQLLHKGGQRLHSGQSHQLVDLRVDFFLQLGLRHPASQHHQLLRIAAPHRFVQLLHVSVSIALLLQVESPFSTHHRT